MAKHAHIIHSLYMGGKLVDSPPMPKRSTRQAFRLLLAEMKEAYGSGVEVIKGGVRNNFVIVRIKDGGGEGRDRLAEAVVIKGCRCTPVDETSEVPTVTRRIRFVVAPATG